MNQQALREKFLGKFPGAEKTEFRGELAFKLGLGEIHDALKFCRDELAFDYLLDISSVDHFGEHPRFEMVYELQGLAHLQHLRLKCAVAEEEAEQIPTATDLWPTADWHEREVYDMMGLKFVGHPDLRRILMWDGYPFFPLRKDFPLEGKNSDVPEVAFTGKAPLAGGPFVTAPTTATAKDREPRAKDFLARE
ncbi:MAG: NADH-quinone oxidoreductase subunit C [Verrucomicrobia bacterium]|nr:NADH-quinone oxidoreductase subunit C [Verrucomicrobiota bacterium]